MKMRVCVCVCARAERGQCNVFDVVQVCVLYVCNMCDAMGMCVGVCICVYLCVCVCRCVMCGMWDWYYRWPLCLCLRVSVLSLCLSLYAVHMCGGVRGTTAPYRRPLSLPAAALPRRPTPPSRAQPLPPAPTHHHARPGTHPQDAEHVQVGGPPRPRVGLSERRDRVKRCMNPRLL